jgi:transposase
MELEPHLRLHLAQAQSNRAPKGRKTDLGDAKRLLKRFVAGELMLSFVPGTEQRAWRMVTRGRLQLVRERVHLQNQIESLLEEGRIKLSSVISDLLGASGWRILRAMASGETNPEALADLGDQHLRCGREVLVDALTGSMNGIHRQLLKQHLDRIELVDRQIEELNKLAAAQMQEHQAAVVRLIEVPGIGAEAAQEILAEIGPAAAAFPSAAQLASWIGVCPGSSQSADHNHSGRCAKGNRFLRRLLCQAAQAAARTKGSRLQSLFKRLIVRLGYVKAIWAIAHRLCRIVWNILHQGARFIELGEAINPKAVQRCINHHLKALRRLGYQIPAATAPSVTLTR